MKRIFFLCFVTLFFSCNSDDSSDIQNEEANFYALKVGNSWVYKNYKYNNNTTLYEDTGVIDSISIVDSEEISGNIFFKFRRMTIGNEENITFCNPNGEHFELLRDSSGYLIKDNGTIRFVNNNYTERLLNSQNWGSIFETLKVGETQMNVASGSFVCINSERYAKTPEGEQLNGLDRFYYSDGVGLIFDTSSFVNNPIHSIERRLVSYVIQ